MMAFSISLLMAADFTTQLGIYCDISYYNINLALYKGKQMYFLSILSV